MFNEFAALILAMLGALFLVHVVQGASGKGTGGMTWLGSFFQAAPKASGS